jgi:NDP-sugar pyrophosphorylase family protein
MKAMVLAAGLGTRLRPLTNDRPKALVELNGHTLLEIALGRLQQFGVREVIINVHHFADLVTDYLARNSNFGMQISISREDVLLDTGGGLKKAAWFFKDSNEPFVLHNVDVISNIDLNRMLDAHIGKHALATVAVQQRPSSRHLLFDENNELCGRRFKDAAPEIARHVANPQALAFCGIHIISPSLLPMITEDGIFSIIPPYLRLAAGGERICAFHADEYYWRDLGTPEHLARASAELNEATAASS